MTGDGFDKLMSLSHLEVSKASHHGCGEVCSEKWDDIIQYQDNMVITTSYFEGHETTAWHCFLVVESSQEDNWKRGQGELWNMLVMWL